MMKFINDQISSSGPVTVTFAIGGPAGVGTYAHASYNRETVDGLFVGVWAPRLELMYGRRTPRGTVIMIR